MNSQLFQIQIQGPPAEAAPTRPHTRQVSCNGAVVWCARSRVLTRAVLAGVPGERECRRQQQRRGASTARQQRGSRAGARWNAKRRSTSVHSSGACFFAVWASRRGRRRERGWSQQLLDRRLVDLRWRVGRSRRELLLVGREAQSRWRVAPGSQRAERENARGQR